MRTLLIVDDEAPVRRLYELILSPLYCVLMADDGSSGLEVALRERPDAVLTDYLMKTRSGLWLAQQLYERHQRGECDDYEKRIILSTGTLQDAYDALPAHDLTADYFAAFLGKPFHQRELYAALDRIRWPQSP